jgi:hypothetical protein
MGFLNPLFLVAGLAVAVPLILHLVHRHETRRLPFPALRYLQRTERQHARQIRLRQLLLLLIRVATILLVVLAAARAFLRGRGAVHDPTAIVMVLDNSMSSGLVKGGRRVLDELQGLALSTLDEATPEDRVWVIRVGEPWDLVTPSTPEAALGHVLRTVVSDAAGDLDAAIARALAIAADADLEAREVHVLSDLQASAFTDLANGIPDTDVPVVVYRPNAEPPANRHLTDVLVGGGLPPIAGQRTDVAASVGEAGVEMGDTVWVRLIVDRRVRAASAGSPGATVVLPGGPYPQGPLVGYVETDPDSLSTDDRRYFAVTVRRAPGLALEGGSPFFLTQAIHTLEQGGRVRRVAATEAEVLVAVDGAGLDRRSRPTPALVVPSTDPALLPALNRRLAASGVPWRYGSKVVGGEVPLLGDGLPTDLTGVRVSAHHPLTPTEGESGSYDVLAQLPAGDPWLVAGQAPTGPYVLIASPLDVEATTLPVSATMVPLLEWIVSRAALPGARAASVEAGQPLRAPAEATAVRLPDGTLLPIDGTHVFRSTRQAGIYDVLAGDSVIDRMAVNVPVRESLLDRLEPEGLRDRYGSRLTLARDSTAWTRAVFTSRQGLEVWRPFLLIALFLLLFESWFAAAGPGHTRSGSGRAQTEADRPDRTRAVSRV